MNQCNHMQSLLLMVLIAGNHGKTQFIDWFLGKPCWFVFCKLSHEKWNASISNQPQKSLGVIRPISGAWNGMEKWWRLDTSGQTSESKIIPASQTGFLDVLDVLSGFVWFPLSDGSALLGGLSRPGLGAWELHQPSKTRTLKTKGRCSLRPGRYQARRSTCFHCGANKSPCGPRSYLLVCYPSLFDTFSCLFRFLLLSSSPSYSFSFFFGCPLLVAQVASAFFYTAHLRFCAKM